MKQKLQAILTQVAEGKLAVQEAQGQIMRWMSAAQAEEKFSEASSKELFWLAFERLKKTANVDELLKISTGLVQQIADNMPSSLGRIPENFPAFGVVGLCASPSGIDSRFSLFRALDMRQGARIEGNVVSGSHWFGVHFAETSACINNQFTASQFSEAAVIQSDFEKNKISLSRIANVTVQESRFLQNEITRSTVSDVSWTTSDFEANVLAKTDFSQSVFNASRIANCTFTKSTFVECEFDSCCWEFVTFDGCEFKECFFQGINLGGGEGKFPKLKKPAEPLVLRGVVLSGKQFKDLEDFYAFAQAKNAR